MTIPWSAWEFDPGIVVALLFSGLLYAFGQHEQQAVSRFQKICFWSGWLSLVLALVSPLHPLGEVLFSAHMVQHEILMLISAPLLVLSHPLVTFLWAFPLEVRRRFGRWSKGKIVSRSWSFLTAPVAAWLIHAAAIWLWHAPPLFQLTLRSDLAHTAQHLSFFLTALLFWWAAFYAHGRKAYGAAFLYVFTTTVHTGILGALLTFSPHVWYPAYNNTTQPWGLTPLEDQQIGGLIMWVPASLVYLAAGLKLLAAWLKESDLRVERFSTPLLLLCTAFLLSSCSNGKAERIGQVTTGGDPRQGAAAIARYGCGSCHTIAGVSGAVGLVGPPLSGVGSRLYLAGVLQNTPENMMRWIRNPKAIDEKTLMPKLGVTEKDAADIGAYLYTLK
jgi:putative membrane protein